MRTSVLALVAVLAFAAPRATAQFDLFDWTWSSPSGDGGGSVTAVKMIIGGPDGGLCAGGSTNSFTTIAPFALTVRAEYDLQNGDKGGPGYDYFVALVDGLPTDLSSMCGDCEVAFNVPAGSSFGFGVRAVDCWFGELSATLENFSVEPLLVDLPVAGSSFAEELGAAVAAIEDLNGDGQPDLLLGAPAFAGPGAGTGRVAVHSSADGALLASITGPVPGGAFGTALAVGDVDGDGVQDIIVGAPETDTAIADSGAVFVYSGATTALFQFLRGEATGDRFGAAVAFAGDVNGDGRGDILVGAPHHDGPGADAGRATVYSGANGLPLHVWPGFAAGDEFGSAVANAGLVDGDAVPDLIVGAPLADTIALNAGRAYVFSGATGGLLLPLTPEPCGFSDEWDRFGTAVAGLGDVDGDGASDLAVGAFYDDCNGEGIGALRIYSGATGALLHVTGASDNEWYLGESVAAAGDVNGDGWPDVLAGAPGQDAWPIAILGVAHAFSGRDGSLLRTYALNDANNQMGAAVAGVPDVNGDGLDDVLIGSPAMNGTGQANLYAGAFRWTDLAHGLAGSNGVPALSGKGLLVTGEALVVQLVSARPSSATTLVVGLSEAYLPFKGGVLVPLPDVLVTGLVTNAIGALSLMTPAVPPLPSGLVFTLQAWVADPATPAGYAASNGLRASVP